MDGQRSVDGCPMWLLGHDRLGYGGWCALLSRRGRTAIGERQGRQGTCQGRCYAPQGRHSDAADGWQVHDGVEACVQCARVAHRADDGESRRRAALHQQLQRNRRWNLANETMSWIDETPSGPYLGRCFAPRMEHSQSWGSRPRAANRPKSW
jgi:hypothetical protein